MSARISRRFALLAPALLGGLLWMGLPGAADAGGWKHGHDKHSKHHGKHHRKHDKHYSKHHSKHHYDHGGYDRGRRGYGHHPAWYGGHRRHGHYYPAPVAVNVYLDGPCGHTYESWGHFSHHVHHHHGVAFVDLPGILVETSFGFAFHR